MSETAVANLMANEVPQVEPVSVKLARYPYPYDSAMSICSDLDETPDRDVYRETTRFLNTTQSTAMGPGVGLEVGNSIFFFMSPDEYSYFGGDDADRELARALMHSGHIDCLHSFGDGELSRAHAERVIEELDRHGCKLEVWVDHSKSPSNFGPDIMRGQGDMIGSEAYHANLTLAYGIRYVWRGRTTGLIGQDAPVNPRAFADLIVAAHPLASMRTAGKEVVKAILGRNGHPRWQMYGANEVCRPSKLRDGQPIWEFLRSNPYWGGSGQGETADGIADVLTPRMLDALVRRRGVCILYTHLGKVRDPQQPFGTATCKAFRLLARYRDEGRILVTTTRRLLRYLTVRSGLRYSASRVGDAIEIALDSVDDPVSGVRVPSREDVDGMTFEVPGGSRVQIVLKGQGPIDSETVRRGDAGFVTIPWRRLTLPSLL